MNIFRSFVGVVAVLVLLLPLVSEAATFKGGDQQDVIIEAPVADDLYAAGNTVLIKEDVADDVMLMGQRVGVSSVIGEDVYALAQFVRLEGVIEDDAHAAGNQVEIEGVVRGDVLAAGQEVQIMESAVVTGDVMLAGQSVTIAGTVEGDVRVASEHFTISDTAVINGNVDVWGGDPSIADGAVVNGEVVQHQQTTSHETSQSGGILLGWVRGVVSQFLVAIILMMGLPVLGKRSLRELTKNTGKSFLLGLGWMVLLVPVMVLLLMSIVGMPLAILLLLTSGMLLIAGSGLAAVVIGRWILGKLDAKRGNEQPAWTQALLGAAIYQGVQLLGSPGWVVTFLVLLAGWGALVLAVWQHRGHVKA